MRVGGFKPAGWHDAEQVTVHLSVIYKAPATPAVLEYTGVCSLAAYLGIGCSTHCLTLLQVVSTSAAGDACSTCLASAAAIKAMATTRRMAQRAIMKR